MDIVVFGGAIFTPILTFKKKQEIGDVENWARSIEMDMRTIATALEYVHKGPLQSSSTWTRSWIMDFLLKHWNDEEIHAHLQRRRLD